VVLRINSPGGSITASDELHQKLLEMKKGNEARKIHAVPHLVVSMGSLAASGGYYIAMPSEKIFCGAHYDDGLHRCLCIVSKC